jgi:predicted RNA-binding protein YlqC (UPF0109 family)
MSDASGPFAVPNFGRDPAQLADDAELDESDDVDEEEYEDDEEFVDDAIDEESDLPEIEDEATESDVTGPAVRSAPVDGGAALAVLEHIARSIVDDPEAVVVDVSSERGGVRLDLHVAPSDMGRIIGRRGRVAQALRSVVRAAAAKDGTDATVDIVD